MCDKRNYTVYERERGLGCFKGNTIIFIQHEKTALHYAAATGNETKARILLSKGADPNRIDKVRMPYHT